MALVDAVTALRASELIALQWKHVGWEIGILQSEFALVESELKETKSRNNPLTLAEPVLQILGLWRKHTPYRSDEDWIFASPHYDGKTPYTYQILFRRHLRPVIEKVAGTKSKDAPIGWHTLRRSLATLLNLKRRECEGRTIAASSHNLQDYLRSLRASRFGRSAGSSQKGRPDEFNGDISTAYLGTNRFGGGKYMPMAVPGDRC